jgi:hypothetical protein
MEASGADIGDCHVSTKDLTFDPADFTAKSNLSPTVKTCVAGIGSLSFAADVRDFHAPMAKPVATPATVIPTQDAFRPLISEDSILLSGMLIRTLGALLWKILGRTLSALCTFVAGIAIAESAPLAH